MIPVLSGLGYRLARFLTQPDEEQESVATCSREALEKTLQPGDVLLIEGSSRISMAIKYITQSTWSHAAIFIGKVESDGDLGTKPLLIEVDVKEGVRTVPLSRYCQNHTRICRPVGLAPQEMKQVIDFMKERLGYKYDLKNIFDLARYLIQTPPVPQKYRRRLLALGSGDPTKAICSSLIAQAFQSVKYPILPSIDIDESSSKAEINSQKEILHIRHHSLFAPRDFDVSPYFEIVKPTIQSKFDYRNLRWANG
ncbi:YiiX/YebB-like N1pC/P60 family cysteine hydrolase [Fodinibius sp. SL11]|uniref:YiiX/YebB-like N1pC/P60 family cysteine hydrolase n=1 Tax=Fodinibius sp. SL11 TaxID=3425690 RepID=UPI003F88135E